MSFLEDINLVYQPIEKRFSLGFDQTIFKEYLGVTRNYEDLITTLHRYRNQATLFFDDNIMAEATPLIKQVNQAVKSEIRSADKLDKQSPPVVLFPDATRNQLWIEAINLTIDSERIDSPYVLHNLILWSYMYLKDIDNSEETIKVVYYDESNAIAAHQYAFLKMCWYFGCDVFYINPSGTPNVHYHAEQEYLGEFSSTTLPYDSLLNGRVIEKVKSTILGFNEILDQTLHSDDSLNYRDWQFKTGTTNDLFYDASLIDLRHNWHEFAKMRQGFGVQNNIVTVPHFFFEIEGTYQDKDRYAQELFDYDRTADIRVIVESNHDEITQEDLLPAMTIFVKGKCDANRIKQSSLYRYDKYNDETERFIIDKIMESLESPLLKKQLTQFEEVAFIHYLLTLDDQVIQTIDNFDFTKRIPKVLVWMEPQAEVGLKEIAQLIFFNCIGFDIIVLSPSAQSKLSEWLDSEFFSYQRFEEITYDFSYRQFEKRQPKKGWLSKLLR